LKVTVTTGSVVFYYDGIMTAQLRAWR